MNGDFSQKLNQVLSNPAMMAQIKALADTMTQENAHAEGGEGVTESPSPDAQEAFALPARPAVPEFFKPSPTFEKNMKNTCALLNALRPFLDERRCAKIDKMLSMIQFAQMAGNFGNFF